MRWKLGYRDIWTLLDADDFIMLNSSGAVGDNTLGSSIKFADVQAKYPVFQISIGEDWADTRHILTVYEGYIVQSYYKRYNIKKTAITPEIIRAIDNISHPCSYGVISHAIDDFGSEDSQIFYWVP